MLRRLLLVLSVPAVLGASVALASTPGGDVRLTNDGGADAGYTSDYTMATGQPASDDVLDECSHSRGRENEPAVAIDPRDHNVVVGSSNDYCGVYTGVDEDGLPAPTGPIWLGYYRSENGGSSFSSSLVPGYPGDGTPYAARSGAREAGAGDPVLAWDRHGRLFAGAEASGDPAGSKKGFGDVFVATFGNSDHQSQATIADGKEFLRSVVVERGSSSGSLTGTFNDKTSIEADRTGGACDGNVYFSWSRFSGGAGNVTIYLSRSTDHGQTFSKKLNIAPGEKDVQFPEVVVTHDGAVHVLFRRFATGNGQTDAILDAKSADCGRTFSRPGVVTTFIPSDAADQPDPVAPTKPTSRPDDPAGTEAEDAGGAVARDCGVLDSHCKSNFKFFRRDTQQRSTSDQSDADHNDVYIVYDATVPGTEDTPTNSTYYTTTPGHGGQAAIFFTRLNGDTGEHTDPVAIAPETTGHQVFPDIAADAGKLHALWWDSYLDPTYSPALPIGNDADGDVHPALDVRATTSSDRGGSWDPPTRLTDETSNPNFDQFSDRTVPFAGDYLWISAAGDDTFGVWTDWRNTVPGSDPRIPGDQTAGGATVLQCRAESTDGMTWGPDSCPRDGGLDQDIYGDAAP